MRSLASCACTSLLTRACAVICSPFVEEYCQTALGWADSYYEPAGNNCPAIADRGCDAALRSKREAQLDPELVALRPVPYVEFALILEHNASSL
ncbi:hypothetical protein D3C72_2096500 [compost metagenome]